MRIALPLGVTTTTQPYRQKGDPVQKPYRNAIRLGLEQLETEQLTRLEVHMDEGKSILLSGDIMEEKDSRRKH